MMRIFLRGAVFAALTLVVSAATPHFRVPPLNQPATAESRPGKFVWADLFAADPAALQKFYTDLFGWEWQPLDPTYAVAYANGLPVAGVVLRPQIKGENAQALWIGFIATADLAATVRTVEAQGGRTVITARSIPDRGQVAVLADAEGAFFGVVQSSSGDPVDYENENGEWTWAQLFTRDQAKAAGFYREVFGYQVLAAPGGQKNSYLLREGVARAGLAEVPGKSERPPQWLGFIRVANIADAVAKAKALGGALLYQPEDSPNVAIITDPAGAALGLLVPASADSNEGGK